MPDREKTVPQKGAVFQRLTQTLSDSSDRPVYREPVTHIMTHELENCERQFAAATVVRQNRREHPDDRTRPGEIPTLDLDID